MFIWLIAGLLAGRAIDRWKEGGLRRWLYLLPLAGVIAINLSLMAIGWSSVKAVENSFNQGMAALETKDYDRAISEFNKAIRLDPKHALAFYNRGLSYE